ncbi:TetR/AcrR family transcriptional regulator [Olivibacter sp. XZL3]|uniref:TetR/AcrR family transcriptional regulator n=1 Tax=Olivibacter sp. XZL3 TaxID=1735116 RepID=UPI001065B024|nr:TetR/AcrR family transcriptional regulator [Olivibacter sp. XZL3]
MRTKDFDENEILKKAISIFWEKGYHATSLYDLIEGLGIGRSSIYHAFGDKHNLFMKALEQYQKEATARIEASLNDAPSVKEGVRALLRSGIVDALGRECPKGCFKVNTEVELAAHDELIRNVLREDERLIEGALIKAIKTGQKEGQINASKDPVALTHFICNTITGLRVYAKTRNDRQFFEGIIETALSVLD